MGRGRAQWPHPSSPRLSSGRMVASHGDFGVQLAEQMLVQLGLDMVQQDGSAGPKTWADNSKGTYGSFYVLSVLSLALMAVVALTPSGQRNNKKAKSSSMITMKGCSVFLLLSVCASTFFLGHLHQNYTKWDESEPKTFAHVLNLVAVLNAATAAAVFFLAEAFRREQEYGVYDDTSYIVERALNTVIIIIFVGSATFSVSSLEMGKMDDKFLVAYMFGAITLGFLLTMLYLDTQMNKNTGTTFLLWSAVAHFVAGLEYVCLDDLCGHDDPSLRQGCPLPSYFNHVALCNVIRMLAMGLLVVGLLKLNDAARNKVKL